MRGSDEQTSHMFSHVVPGQRVRPDHPQRALLLDYSILFRRFVGLGMDEEIWSPTTFSKKRDRLLEGDIAAAFFDAVVDQARQADLLSDEHFTVDGTLLEAWASLKSVRPKGETRRDPPDDPGILRSISTGNRAETTRISRRPIRTRCWRAREPGGRPSCRTPARPPAWLGGQRV